MLLSSVCPRNSSWLRFWYVFILLPLLLRLSCCLHGMISLLQLNNLSASLFAFLIQDFPACNALWVDGYHIAIPHIFRCFNTFSRFSVPSLDFRMLLSLVKYVFESRCRIFYPPLKRIQNIYIQYMHLLTYNICTCFMHISPILFFLLMKIYIYVYRDT